MFSTVTEMSGPSRYYETKEAALVAARRRFRRNPDYTVDVVWCRDGNPKVWLASVTADGVTKTKFWQ